MNSILTQTTRLFKAGLKLRKQVLWCFELDSKVSNFQALITTTLFETLILEHPKKLSMIIRDREKIMHVDIGMILSVRVVLII